MGAGWTEVVAFAASGVIAVAAPPAGISGAVLLLPFQVSVLGTPSPAVTPGQLAVQHRRDPRRAVPLLAAGTDRQAAGPAAQRRTLPGAIAGSVIRVELLPGPETSRAAGNG